MSGDSLHHATSMAEGTSRLLLKNSSCLMEYRNWQRQDISFELNTLVKRLELSYCGLLGCDAMFFGS